MIYPGQGKIVFCEELEMPKIKVIKPSVYTIAMPILSHLMLATGAQDMMKSTPSNMDDIYEHVIEYGSY